MLTLTPSRPKWMLWGLGTGPTTNPKASVGGLEISLPVAHRATPTRPHESNSCRTHLNSSQIGTFFSCSVTHDAEGSGG